MCLYVYALFGGMACAIDKERYNHREKRIKSRVDSNGKNKRIIFVSHHRRCRYMVGRLFKFLFFILIKHNKYKAIYIYHALKLRHKNMNYNFFHTYK